MSRKVRVEDNGMVVVHEIPESVPRIFADGFGPSLYGYPLTTVTLFQQEISDPDEPTVLQRKTIMTIELPTVAILELAQNIQKTLRENKKQVEASMALINSIIDKDV